MRLKLRRQANEVRLLRAAEVCRLLGISTWTLRQWLRRGEFPRPVYISDGAPMRFRLAEVERWLDGRQRRRRKPMRRGMLKREAE